MSVDLELSVLQPAREGLGFIAGFAVTDQLLVAVGGTTTGGSTILASSNARSFERRTSPRDLGMRDALAVGDTIWICGERGLLAASRDGGESWTVCETGTDTCLLGIATTSDGTVWVCGERGYVARVSGRDVERIDFATTARLQAIYAVKETIVTLGDDGIIHRWVAGDLIRLATGSDGPLNALLVTRTGTWRVPGYGGFTARSPDCPWFSRVRVDTSADFEAVASCGPGSIVCVGAAGALLVSDDDGRAWHAMRTGLTDHLWSVESFGKGVLIGGDRGLIGKLAPHGDDTWSDRIDMFLTAGPLDAVLAAGPVSFIDKGLASYLAAVHGETGEVGLRVEARDERIVRLHEQGDRDEIHVRDRVLEAGGDERGEREDHGEDLVGHRVGGQAEPDREADQRVGQHAEEHRLAELQGRLGRSDVQGAHAGGARTALEEP